MEPVSPSLASALEEIARVASALAAADDLRTLSRYGDPANGAEIAERLGYALLTTDEARTVSRLAYLDESPSLIRAYLEWHGIPRRSAAVALELPAADDSSRPGDGSARGSGSGPGGAARARVPAPRPP